MFVPWSEMQSTMYSDQTGGAQWPYGVVTTTAIYTPVALGENEARFNPKFWAQWFREFLFELLGQWRGMAAIKERDGVTPRASQHCRSAPMWREWKWKNWCQELEV